MRVQARQRRTKLAFAAPFLAVAGCNALIGANDPILRMEAADASGCVLNSDCATPAQVCIFRVCSPPCHADEDCVSGSRCLRTDAGTACVVNGIAACDAGQECPTGSTCQGAFCRNSCQSSSDCQGGQACTGGACVGNDPAHDPGIDASRVDTDGSPAEASPADAAPDRIAMTSDVDVGAVDGSDANSPLDAPPDTEGGEQPDGGCAPNAKRCASGDVQTCDANGSWGATQTCPHVCIAGQCGGACAPGSMQCGANNTPQSCDNSGQWTSGMACANVCVNGGCAAACQDGTKQCSSGVPQTCSSGVWVNGTACPYVCNGGTCTGLCVPNSTQCSTTTQQQTCDTTGQWAAATTCPYVCTGKACGGVCTPSSTQCTSTTQQETCATDGTWGAPMSCTNACVGNGVGSQCGGVCVPGTTQCQSSTQQQTCGTNGQWQTATTCMYACVGAGVGGTCGGTCVPNSKTCSDSTHNETCDSTGQWGTPAACPLPYPPNPGCNNGNCAYHGGLDQDGGGTDTLPGGYVYAIQFSVSVPTTASRVGMFTKATGHSVRMGIYSNAGNNLPQTLQSQTATFATAVGVVEAPLAAPVTLNAGTYWIAAISDADISMAVTTSGGFTWNNNSMTWPTLPNTFPSGPTTNNTETPDFYVVLQAQ